jgi:hypothetical protein
MITKVFLTNILSTKIEKIEKIEDNKVFYYTQAEWYKDQGESILDEMNLDTLTRECKDWARENEYLIASFPADVLNDYIGFEDEGGYTVYLNVSLNENGSNIYDGFHADTELEAVIEACEYIIEQKKN